MIHASQKTWKRYTVAILCPLLALILQATVWPYIPPTPELFFYPAVALVAWSVGLWPGLLAVVLSALAMAGWFLPPFNPQDILDLGIFSLGGSLVVGLIARLQDASREAKQAQAKAEAATLAQEAIMGIVSHDLKNPLLTIHLCVAQIRRQTRDPSLLAYSDRIQRAADMANRLVLNVLDVARVRDEDALPLHKETTTVPQLLQEATDTFLPLAAKKDVRLTIKDTSQGAAVSCDKDRIVRVLANLISNAMDFVPGGGSVDVCANDETQEVVFEVHDTGPGFTEEQQVLLFEPRWKGARGRTGLGLYIAKQLVEMHGGRIWAQAGEGATFFFALPKAA